MKYMLLDGALIPSDNELFTVENRAFRYGDALFESMHASGSTVQFFDLHLQRLRAGMRALEMEIPLKFSQRQQILHQEIEALLHKSRQFQGVGLRLSVFRRGGGKFRPVQNNVSYTITAEKLENALYKVNSSGLKVDIFKKYPLIPHFFSPYKTANALPYILAAKYAHDNLFDDVLLTNPKGKLVESSSSNIFLVHNKTLLTPDATMGCLPGIMRQQIIEISKEQGFKVAMSRELGENELYQADELFLTNAVRGIQWVSAWRDKRYFNFVAKKLTDALNRKCFDA